MSRADAAIDVVVWLEGRYDNDPRDSGGQTFYGHDTASWPDLRRRVPDAVREALPAAVSGLSGRPDLARLAYRAGYWDWCRCDDLPAPIALMTFDAAVNQGWALAPFALQLAVGATPDGVIGPKTISRAQAVDVLEALAELVWQRELRYRAAPQWATYGHGWIRRLGKVCALALVYDDDAARTRLLGLK